MEVVMSTQGINTLFAALGCPVGDDYIIGDDCQATLEEILTRLYKEDKYVRGFRRLIANSQVIKKDLLPLFYNVKSDNKILDLIIQILENLMIPVECLFPIHIMIKEDAGRSTICQLNWLLTACKEAFLNPAPPRVSSLQLRCDCRILENLMIPVECLFPIDIMIKEDAGRSTICQLNWLLTACKEAFLNPAPPRVSSLQLRCDCRILENLMIPAECLFPIDIMIKEDAGRSTICQLNWLLTACKEAFLNPAPPRVPSLQLRCDGRILENLMIPVECLFPIDIMIKEDAGRSTICQLNWLLTACKEAFLNPAPPRVSSLQLRCDCRILENLMIPVECLFPIDIMIKEDAGRSTICQLNCLLTACKEAFLNPAPPRVSSLQLRCDCRILENLMIPVECLFPIDIMIKEDAGRSTICQLNWLLTACKEAFLNPAPPRVPSLQLRCDGRILENLMIPVECLFPIDIMIKEDAGRSTICQLNWLLTACKEAFLNPAPPRVSSLQLRCDCRILENLMIPVECLFPIDIMIKEDAGRSTICQLNCLLTACKEAFLNPAPPRVSSLQLRCDCRILENLMIPVECLFPIDIMIKGDAGRSTICQLNWLLTACKEAFLNPAPPRVSSLQLRCDCRILENLMIPAECLFPIDIMIKEDAGRSTICQLNCLLTACKEAFLNPAPPRVSSLQLRCDCRILENLMIPVECLFPIDIMIKEDAGRSTICQLNWLLTACKEAFLNPCATKSVIDYMKLLSKKQVSEEGAHSISKCLQLLRNLLHIPEVRGGVGAGVSHQNQIIWNLFTQHIDKVLITLMTGNGRALWAVTVVQLISLLYKDQHSNIIHKLLAIWCDTALSESSEDDESNTSPQDQGSGGWSSSMATTDHTSDSSDSDQRKRTIQSHAKQAAQHRMTEILANGIGRKTQLAMRNKHGNSKNWHPVKPRHTDMQELHMGNKDGKMCWTVASESGIGSSIGSSECHTSVEGLKMDCGPASPESKCGCGCKREDIQETISTSSNEDKEPARFKKKPVHQKPLHMIQKSRYINGKIPMTSQSRKDIRREKLMKRSKTSTLNIKTFLNYTPNEEDISHLLKEFTIDFLLKGYGSLVTELKSVVLTSRDVEMDTAHFSWSIVYFLRYATLLELDLQLISPVLSYDIISYLTYEGVNLCEELEVAKLQVGGNLTTTLKKLYLVVSSLKEIFFTVESYKKMKHLTQADRDYLRQLDERMAHTTDLRCLFILLLRHFDPLVQSHQFLQDVVTTNHSLLLLIEGHLSKDTMAEHIKQFATEDVMKQYGTLLTCFEDNGEMVNNCIFTMMHHIAGDLEKVSVLCQPAILSSFTRILEADIQLRDDWSDLIEYVIQKCLKSKQVKNGNSSTTKPCRGERELKTSAIQERNHDTTQPPCGPEWNKEDLDNLCWYLPQSLGMQDPVGHISRLFLEHCGVHKSRREIIENLLKQGLIGDEEYKCLMARESPVNNPEKILNNTPEMDVLDGIQVIIDYLHSEKCGFFVKWLQSCLLEACYARLVVDEQQQPQYDLVEPVAYFNTMLKLSVPLVTWTQDLWKVMQLEPSIWLLSALNIHLPTRTGEACIFARIPAEWTPDHLYVAALILGPIDSSNVKFDPSKLDVIQQTTKANLTTAAASEQPSSFGFFLGSSLKADWIQKVKQLKTFPKVQPTEGKHERMSLISGDERDWDLISMCVSDEDLRHDNSTVTPLH